MKRSLAPPLLAVAGLILAAALLAGCGDDSVSPPPDDGTGNDGWNFTEPAAVIAAHAEALTERRIDMYTALLVPPPDGRGEGDEFRYYPRSDDLDDFPWLNGNDFWGRDEELGILGHMFDPNFVSSETSESIDAINASIQVLSSAPEGEEIVVVTNFSAQVLWATDAGLAVDAQLVFRLVTDVDGFLRIGEIHELPGVGRSETAIEAATWGQVKSLYR
jgi:hypothetical protein